MRLSNMPSRISQSQIGDESHTRLSSAGDEATRRSYSRPLKQVSWISTKKLESLADIQVTQVTSKELKNLHTCVPYHLEGPGLVVNDIQDDVPKCQDNPSELPTPTKAPSDDLLFRAPAGTREEATEALRTPVGVDTELTMDMLKSGLKNIARVGNGYHLNYSHVDLSNQNLRDISPISRFSSLVNVDISGNYIQSVEALGFMPYLRVVNASRNDIEAFAEFRAPIALEQINFSRNRISRLVNLDQLWALTEANLSHNKLVIANGFESCSHLRVLDLSHNHIETIDNLRCPSLVALFLHNNNIREIMNLDDCPSLRALSLGRNHIDALEPLRCLTELHELWLESNRINDITQLEHLKPLLNLTSLCIEYNPVTAVGMWRLIVTYTLPQLRYLDGERILPQESVQAKNTFNPSFEKVALENRMAVLLDRACQAASTVFDDSVYRSSLPPILLLVGAPMSNCYKLTVMIKEKFRTRVQLGGVHSTATTLEFPNTSKDVPVSFESFAGMKQRGEFLAYSHILGRVCGFATAQITRAYERNAILVAAVPLTVALTLRNWKLKAKMVLVMPTGGTKSLKFGVESSTQPLVLEDVVQLDDADLERNISMGMKDEKRSRIASISFSREEEFYDLDRRGSKYPNKDPAGPGLLKVKHKDEIPEVPESFLEMFSKEPSDGSDASMFGRSKSDPATLLRSLNQKPISAPAPKEVSSRSQGNEDIYPLSTRRQTASDNDVLVSALYRASAPEVTEIFSSGSNIRDSAAVKEEQSLEEIVNQFSSSLSENPQGDNSSSPPPFTTEGTAKPARFSTLTQMTKLRRIASLFLQYGGSSDFAQIFRDFPSNFDLGNSIQNMNWTATLLGIDGPKVPANDHAYFMLYNRCNNNEKSQNNDDKAEMATLMKGLRRCCVKAPGAYELLFLKTSLINDMEKLSATTAGPTPMDQMTQDGIQGRLFGAYQSPRLTNHLEDSFQQPPQTERPVLNNTEGRSRIPSKLLGLRSAGDRSETSTTDAIIHIETTPFESNATPPGALQPGDACMIVVNPNYAFGPHEVCCANRLSRPLTAKACGGSDLDRGTFFDGNFQSNFLESDAALDDAFDKDYLKQETEVTKSEEIEDEDEDEEEDNEEEEDIDQVEEPQEYHSCGSAQFVPQEHEEDEEEEVERDGPEEHEEELAGEVEECLGEFDEDRGKSSCLRQTAPPPSVDSSSKKSSRSGTASSIKSRRTTTSIVETYTDDNDTDESATEIESCPPSVDSHHRRKLRQRAETSILNTREEYIEFHQDNPGFFCTVIDSDDLEKCLESLSSLLNDMITEFDKQRPMRNVSYAGRNRTDGAQFMNQRLSEFRQLSTGFAKGIPQRATTTMSTPGASSCFQKPAPAQIHTNFQRSKCPPNLLEPTINRKPRNAKIRRIIQNH